MDKDDIATLIFIEEIKTEREGMIAENQLRAYLNRAPAYDESSFYSLIQRLRELLKRV